MASPRNVRGKSADIPGGASADAVRSTNQPYQPTGYEEVRPSTAVDGRAAPKENTQKGRAEEQRLVMVALGEYAKAHAIPPMDRGLRSIVVQQVGNLLKGGWPMEEIKAQALSVFSQYNLASGHKLMTQLQRTMELADEERRIKAHEVRKNAEVVDPKIAQTFPSKSMPDARWRHPNNHKFEWDSSTSCRICGGPPGVHVRPVSAVGA